eukprot:TRINITY_DN8803_c1_g1_i1.p2 TRINITY_DN8803_c1_g1~~TRINITY_DN8803_c1_g1_i1.p2  ORF type:complete len:406 (+),score=101.20 TRINITY_DN8803_c1_g1_i1:1460-2677(+)
MSHSGGRAVCGAVLVGGVATVLLLSRAGAGLRSTAGDEPAAAQSTSPASPRAPPPQSHHPAPPCGNQTLAVWPWLPQEESVNRTLKLFDAEDVEHFDRRCREAWDEWRDFHLKGLQDAVMQQGHNTIDGTGTQSVCLEQPPEPTVRTRMTVLRAVMEADAVARAPRRVFIDAGANMFAQRASGAAIPSRPVMDIGSTPSFACGYPGGHTYELFAFEAMLPDFGGIGLESQVGCKMRPIPYMSAKKLKKKKHKLRLRPCFMPWHPAVKMYHGGVSKPTNDSLYFSRDLSGTSEAGRLVPTAVGEKNPEAYTKVRLIDFEAFLRTNFTKEDFVILKLDIEGAEHGLVEHLVQTGTAKLLLDEVFFECHPSGDEPGVQRSAAGLSRPASCWKLMNMLRKEGVLVHDWF